MNPDFDNPREELEARLTALALGELTPEEAASVRQAIEKDPQLAALCKRIQKTVELIRATANGVPEHASATAAPLRLNNDRREKLFARFKTVTPREFARPRRRMADWLLPVAAAAAFLVLLGGLLLPALSRTKSRSLAQMKWSADGAGRGSHFSATEPTPAGTKSLNVQLNEELSPQVQLWDRGASRQLQLASSAEPEARRRYGLAGVETAPTTLAPSAEVPAPAAGRVDRLSQSDRGRPTVEHNIVLPAGGKPATTEGGLAGREITISRGSEAQDWFFDGNLVKAGQGTPLKYSADARLGDAAKSSGVAAGTAGEQLGALEAARKALTPAPAASQPGDGRISGPETINQPAPVQIAPDQSVAFAVPPTSRPVAPPATPVEEAVTVATPTAGAFVAGGGFGVAGGVAAAAPATPPPPVVPGKPVAPAPLDAGYATAPSAAPAGTVAGGQDYFALVPEAQATWGHYDNDGAIELRGLVEREKLAEAKEGAALDPEKKNRAFGFDWYLGNQLASPDAGLSTSKMPMAGDIPVVGRLFRAEGKGDFAKGVSPEPAIEKLARKELRPAQTRGELLQEDLYAYKGKAAGQNLNGRRSDELAAPQPNDRTIEKYAQATATTNATRGRFLLRQAEGVESDTKADRPAVPPPVPQPEVATRENAFSTFSLNVSDVSFKLAGASLEKGAMPDPGSIRSEEFINAFDYRDPEPAPGLPVAFAWERAAWPFAQNRDLLRFSIKTAAQGRQPGRPLNLVLLLDNSGSMERADRVRIIREALRVLAAQLQPQDKLSVVTFSRTARLWVDGVPGSQAGQVAEQVGGLTPEGGTNLEEALKLAYETAARHYLPYGINRVVLLTDGAANLGDVDPDTLKQKVEAHRKQGIALDGFGIGWEGYNDDLLEVLTRNGDGRYGFINTPEAAATEFAGQLAGALQVAASDVKVQIEFNPRRVTAYRQVGYAKHQLKKEQFRDNTVDAAEIGAAESGNALYVIETNPGGNGPLATVRVRYKIPGTQEYREQEWSVAYTGSATPLEKSGIAMRLAATAGAFSEWLASNPYAAEVNSDRLLALLRGVPEAYGADERPKKLEWMIRQAKSLSGN